MSRMIGLARTHISEPVSDAARPIFSMRLGGGITKSVTNTLNRKSTVMANQEQQSWWMQETADPELALLPCPFCGGKDIDPKGWASQIAYGPQCQDCGATAETRVQWNMRANA